MRAQELYNQYCRKEITVESFLYHVRRDPSLKEIISPVNSAEDVILILKQKVGICEQVSEDMIIQEKGSEDENGEDIKDAPESDEDLDEYADGDEDKYQEIDDRFGNDEIRKTLSGYDVDNLGFDLAGEAMNAILMHKDWADRWDIQNPADLNTIKAWRDSIVKKKQSVNESKKLKKTVDDINPYEFRKGWKYEYECDPKLQQDQNIDKAKEIALKNIIKDPIYYTNLFSKKPNAEPKKSTKPGSEKADKSTNDKVELKDKVGQMKPVKKDKGDKSNVKGNMGNQEKAKGSPKGVKTMKLKESIRKELRSLLKEDVYNQHVEALRDMVKMKPEDLAKQVLDNKLPMTGLRKDFVAKVLGKHVADGNTSPEVKQAFLKVNDKLNESVNPKVAKKADEMVKITGSKEKAIAVCDQKIKDAYRENSEKYKNAVISLYTQIKSYLTGKTEEPVKADTKTFSINERVTVGDFDTWKTSVIELLQKTLKTDDKAASKIFSHYEKEFKQKHETGKDAKTSVKEFTKTIKTKKEEFEGNTPPKEADYQDTELNEDFEKKHVETMSFLKRFKSDIKQALRVISAK